ncbi:hypothetical protein PPTG_21782 [Phytophthora nicotianae INRA-310]|uniref:Uncharacterized protein n=1 Tax=Phytophthora nicotianae (strain INRA-310) TaxID=761204 RepID=W2QV41_PHYN3|nr:hypothetical protein PPTG_21782 [Phytophthora nicotianae INRA-310]ETN16786.1 hypothetical protein PPTG_21782 [Phytophthora nicotianae INRA-310]
MHGIPHLVRLLRPHSSSRLPRPLWVANCCQVVYNDKDYEVERTEDFEDLDLSLLKMRGLEDASYLQPEEALQCADCDIDWV